MQKNCYFYENGLRSIFEHIPIMKIYLLIISFFLIIFNISAATAQEISSFTVKGSVDTVPHSTYYVNYYISDSTVRDTISLDKDGNFNLRGESSEPLVITLAVENKYDKDILGNYLLYRFWVEPGKETYFKGLSGAGNQVVRNSHTQQLMETLDAQKKVLSSKRWELWRKIKDNNSTAIKRSYDAVLKQVEQKDIQFIEDHPDEYYAAYVLYTYIYSNSNFYSQGKHLFNKLTTRIKRTKLGASIQLKLDEQRIVQLGETLPDFSAQDTLGRTVNLSDFRGKYVLVDFWASWCVPCRRENPNLVKIYEDYKAKGFEIVAVSLDDRRDEWIKAIEKDRLNWFHVSDLAGPKKSALAKQYSIEGVPDNFLLDREGKIIGRNLRGNELREKIATLR